MNKKPCMMCVHCATPVDAVYVEYSPGNIRLSVCAKCEHTADEYVECEMMIVLIDLVLQKSKAYRHIFFNYPLLHKLSMRVYVYCTFPAFVFLSAQYVPGVFLSSCEIALSPWCLMAFFISLCLCHFKCLSRLNVAILHYAFYFLVGAAAADILFIQASGFSPILSDTPLPCLIMAGVCMEGESPCSSS